MGKSYRLNGEAVDVEEFLADNEESLDAEDVSAIRGLGPGQEVTFGGGAAPVFTLSVEEGNP